MDILRVIFFCSCRRDGLGSRFAVLTLDAPHAAPAQFPVGTDVLPDVPVVAESIGQENDYGKGNKGKSEEEEFHCERKISKI